MKRGKGDGGEKTREMQLCRRRDGNQGWEEEAEGWYRRKELGRGGSRMRGWNNRNSKGDFPTSLSWDHTCSLLNATMMIDLRIIHTYTFITC